jgi:AcrR family transcriptional regulator
MVSRCRSAGSRSAPGVGAGTVYRHFPSKEILIEAVLTEHVTGLVAAADRWTALAAPGEALFGFLLEVIERSVGRKHICDALTVHRGWPHAGLCVAIRRFHEALEQLLGDAKRAGAIAADVRTDDLTAIALGGAALRLAHGDPSRGTRLMRLLLNGLRAALVTEATEFRDGYFAGRHETARHCVECGIRLHIHSTGRPPRYCGPTCRQRARRRRIAG